MDISGYMPVKTVSGKDCVIKNAELFALYGKKCLILTGRGGAEKSGALDDCLTALAKNGIKSVIYDKTEQNPLVSGCLEAGALAREFGAEFIVGIGGGSAMDAAKAVALFAADPKMDEKSIFERKTPSPRLPLILIGTTAGTGSEVTGVSVLTESSPRRKRSISGADCYAEISFCDPKYTFSVPYGFTVSAALDAYCHASEALLAYSCNDLCALYAKEALKELYPFVSAPSESALSEETRIRLYRASLIAGLAINISGTAFPHSVGYYLTESHGVPHGRACAVFAPVLLKRAEKYRPERLELLCGTVGDDAAEIARKIKAAADVRVKIDEAEACSVSLRWKDVTVKNFDRSPGGFTYSDAAQALMSV